MTSQEKLFSLTPENFKPHTLHGFDQNFRETNCYTDLVIELVNGLGLNPIACLACTLAAEFEGDQWTFGKPSHHDLMALYGLKVEELSLYRPLLDQVITQIDREAIPMIEVDSYYLPDTIGIDYRSGHVKTTIAITHVDVSQKLIRYFHNATFAELRDEDFDGIFSPEISTHSGYLPPYCEIAKLSKVHHKTEAELRSLALKQAKFHFYSRQAGNNIWKNSIAEYALAMSEHQNTIITLGNSFYHAYTFVALRQLGSSYQLGAHFLRWLDSQNSHFLAAAIAFDRISELAKMLVLKLARVANSGKTADLTSIFDEMVANCETAHSHLTIGLGN